MTMKKIRAVFFLCAVVAVLLMFSRSVSGLSEKQDAAAKQHLEDAIRRTAVACYGAEGVFPPSIEYMQQYYGLQYDQSQLHVHYELFASNLMPDITVMEK